MRRALPVVLVLLAASSAAAALVPRIVNGVYTSAYPTVGALLAGSSAGTATLQCTGTLIGCRTFLTAAHCVCDGNGPDCLPGGATIPDPSRLFVFLQHAGTFAVESIALRSDYVFPVADVAVLRLAVPVTGIRPTPLNEVETPAEGTPGTIVGFGRQGGSVYDYGLKRAGAVALSSCASASPLTSVCWAFRNPLGPPGDDSNTCNGDSGGPLFVDFGGGDVLAGVTSGGSAAQCTPPDDSFDANVFQYASWITAQGAGDVPASQCGTLGQVGDPSVDVLSVQGSLGSVPTSSQFTFDAPPALDELRVALNADDAADFDLYLRVGAPPTTTTFDCKVDDPNQFGACRIASPAAGTWYVLVQRFSGSGAFQVTTTVFGQGGSCAGIPLGDPCDDGNACTAGDVCGVGGCAGTPVVDGTPCDDGAACTHDDACLTGGCQGSATPRADCLATSPGGGSALLMKDASPDDRDALLWRWTQGSATPADFGTPTLGGRYALCLYDDAGGLPSLLSERTLPGGAGWSATRGGFKYASATGAPGGIVGGSFRASAGSGAHIVLKGRGSSLAMPHLPLMQDPAVVVQLVGPATCFEARYTAASTNDGSRFRARSR